MGKKKKKYSRCTGHGLNRAAQRLGVPKGTAHATARNAWSKGVKFEEMAGAVESYARNKLTSHRGTRARFYAGFLFFFTANGRLITAYPLPPHIVSMIEKERDMEKLTGAPYGDYPSNFWWKVYRAPHSDFVTGRLMGMARDPLALLEGAGILGSGEAALLKSALKGKDRKAVASDECRAAIRKLRNPAVVAALKTLSGAKDQVPLLPAPMAPLAAAA